MLTDEYSRTSGYDTPQPNATDSQTGKIHKLRESLLYLYLILLCDLFCICIVPNILLNLNNVLTLLIFFSVLSLEVYVLTKFPADMRRLIPWLRICLVLSILLLLLIIGNYFYLIYDKIIANFFRLVNLYEGGQIVIGIFYFSVLLYGTMNIFAPVWMIHEITRMSRLIHKLDAKILESQNRVELVNCMTTTDV